MKSSEGFIFPEDFTWIHIKNYMLQEYWSRKLNMCLQQLPKYYLTNHIIYIIDLSTFMILKVRFESRYLIPVKYTIIYTEIQYLQLIKEFTSYITYIIYNGNIEDNVSIYITIDGTARLAWTIPYYTAYYTNSYNTIISFFIFPLLFLTFAYYIYNVLNI